MLDTSAGDAKYALWGLALTQVTTIIIALINRTKAAKHEVRMENATAVIKDQTNGINAKLQATIDQDAVDKVTTAATVEEDKRIALLRKNL